MATAAGIVPTASVRITTRLSAKPMQALYAQLLWIDQRLVLRAAQSGLAVIFGMLNIINFAHGALYMMGAFSPTSC